jgi:hypothetical protein
MLVDLEFSPEDLAFQGEVGALMRDNYSDHIRKATVFVDAPMEAAQRSCSATLSPGQCWVYRTRATRLQATGGNQNLPPSEEKRFGFT